MVIVKMRNPQIQWRVTKCSSLRYDRD